MNTKKLLELRQTAERAVSDMNDGDLKVKAFEVILSHLMQEESPVTESAKQKKKAHASSEEPKEKANTKSTVGRILVIREEGFFKNPKSISEVCDQLASNGWHILRQR